MNFKDWKLISQDGQKAKLKHANGHEMTLALKSLPKIQREQVVRLAKANEYKDGGEVQKFDEGSPDTVQSGGSGKGDVNIHIDSGGTPTTQPPMNPAAQYAAQPVKVQPVTVQPGVPNVSATTGQVNPTAVAQNSQEAIKDKAQIAAAQAAASVPIEQKYIEGVGQAQQNIQDLSRQMHGHVDDFNGFVQENPIDPNHYQESMNAGKKTLSGLGLILGGMGAGKLGSTDNPALRFLNQQIDRDIAAQQQRVNNQKTVLGAYQDLYGQGVAANNLTKASLLDIYNHKAQLLANQLGTPTAMAVAKELGAASALEKENLIKTSALDINSVPGTRPTSSDEGAMNVPHGGQATPQIAQQATAAGAPPAGAKSAPITSREWVNAEGNPVTLDERALKLAGVSPNASESDLEENGIYPKENPRAAQLKDITAHEIPPLLKDNQTELFNKYQYRTDKGMGQGPIYNSAHQQRENAQFIDDNLKDINKYFGQVIDSTEKAGVTGRIADIGSGAIGGLTGAVGSIFGHGEATGGLGAGATGAMSTGQMRLRDNALNNIEAIVNASLNGVKGVDAATVHRWVQAAKPVYGDTPSQIRQKYESLITEIKKHANTTDIKDLLR